MTEGIFCLLLKKDQKRDKKLEVLFFLAHLLVPLVASKPRFYLVLKVSALGLIIGLAISGAEFISWEVANSFFGWSR